MRYGWVHMYNNLLEAWIDFGVRATQQSRVFSEKNIYLAGPESTEAITLAPVDKDTLEGYVRMRNPRDDLALGGAVLVANDDGTLVSDPDYTYAPAAADAADAGGLLEQSIAPRRALAHHRPVGLSVRSGKPDSVVSNVERDNS